MHVSVNSKDLIPTGAIHRYYESRRRLFNDSRPARREKAAETRVKARKQSLRRKVGEIFVVCYLCTFCLAIPQKAEVCKR